MNVGIILSSGEGKRFGGDVPKQYCNLNGKKIITYSIEAMKECQDLDKVIVVCNKSYIEEISNGYDVECIEGGDTRNESLFNGLNRIKKLKVNCEKVLIQEAARPFLTKKIISDYIHLLEKYDAVITAKKITDSLGSTKSWVVNRENYYLIQAPEAFQYEKIFQYFNPNSSITATVQQLPKNSKVFCYYEFIHNLKITYNEDLKLAEMMMKGK